MKLVAFCGAAGAGKDTAADMLPASKFAFADSLYSEVAKAWGVMEIDLRERAAKELPSAMLSILACNDLGFCVANVHKNWEEQLSPRKILQWWGDYRRSQEPDYFVRRLKERIGSHANAQKCIAITDCRFPNEAAMVRELGGEIWQIVRPGVDAGGTGHISDTDGTEFKPDRIIHNMGDIDSLKSCVESAWGKAK